MPSNPQRGMALWLKRALDLAVVLSTAVVWLPVLALLALLVRWRMGSPVLFRQTRPGQFGRPFTILKLRTMTESRTPEGERAPDADRLTPMGRRLRSWSLDEVPELLNVLRGDMSLVGPRPLLVQYLPKYSARQMRRHDVLPGLTGLAQVKGRNAVAWNERLELDVQYVEHWSLWLDVRILALTVVSVLRRDGISQAGHATAEEFSGTAEKPPGASKGASTQVD